MKVPALLALFMVALGAAACASSAASPTLRPGSSRESTTPHPTSRVPESAEPAGTGAPTVSARPTSTAKPLVIDWTEQEFDGSISAITADAGRFVAAGSRKGGGSAAWTSSDGMTWTEHEVPERSFGEIGDGVELTGSMGHLVRLGDTLYSFGSMTFMDSAQGAAWRWTDGGDWEVIESDSAFFGGRPIFVAAGADSLIAGVVSFERGLYGTYSTWTWTPATRWLRTGLSSSADEEIAVRAVAWGGGTFLAAGSRAPRVDGAQPWDWPHTPAIWTSSDGRDWTAVEPPDGMATACSVTALSDGRFAILGTAEGGGAAWVVDREMDWVEGSVQSPGGDDVQPSDRSAVPCSAVAVSDALLATGQSEQATLVWTSANGLDWTFMQRFDLSAWSDQGGWRVAALENKVLMIGTEVVLRGTVR